MHHFCYFKVEPEHVDYFYTYLGPWTYYIPVRPDLSDLMKKIE